MRLLGLLLFFYGSAFGQTGVIKGRILSSENQEPLTGATVSLVHTKFVQVADSAGHFLIDHIPAGSYVLLVSSVGHQPLKQKVKVEGNETTELTVTLAVRIIEDSVILRHYLHASSFTRTDIPLLELPQSAQVLSPETIKDRQAFTLNEMAPLMTGVKANNGMGAFTLRGFTGYNPFDGSFISFNGIRGNLYQWSQQPLLYNIEKIELLRGPSSVLYSEGVPGGLINFVTRKPQAQKRFEFNASYGAWNYARFSADATGPITKKLLYRLIAGYDRSNSFRDQQEQKNFFVAPSLTYLFSTKTNLNLEVNYSHQKSVHQYDRGTFIKPTADGGFDFDYYPNHLTVQSPGDFGKARNTSVGLTFNHRVNDRLSFTMAERYVDNTLNFADHGVSGVIRNDSISRSYQIWNYAQFSWQNTAYLNYRWKNHRLLAGIDYNHFGWTKNDYRNSPSTRMYILNPDYSSDVPAPNAAVDYYDDNKQSNHLIGAYLQDQVSLGSRFKVLLSLRYDHYKLKQTPLSARDDLQGDTSDAEAWMPRVGLVYLLQPNISFYANYNRSFNPQRSNASGAGGPFPPRVAEQFEIGYKGDYYNGALCTMVALYTIRYRNILAADPTPQNPNQQTVVDGTRSQGVELTVQGNIRHLNIMAGYAFNEHELTSDNTLGKKGYRYINAPKHLANLWVKYDFSMGLGIGVGGRYTSDQVGNLATQQFVIPESTVLDAVVNYETGRFNVQCNLNNITDARYFQGGVSRVTIASLGNPFNVRFGVNYIIN